MTVLYGTHWDNYVAICWLIVALGAGISIFKRSCNNPIECTALAILSITAAARARAIWNRDITTVDAVLVTTSLAVYVLVRLYEGWRKERRKEDHGRRHSFDKHVH